jgi:RNase adaptor protein for sRNA GlmZ degradation
MNHEDVRPDLVVAVVGPSASGKSTLVARLKDAGYAARHVAQEHSYVKDMWQRIHPPDVLIYLDVSYEVSRQRRPVVRWGPDRHTVEVERLSHARQHCDLYIDTSSLTPDEVSEKVFAFLSGI